jgi:hypothetical protein
MQRFVWSIAGLFLSATSATALDMPPRKAGLWELRMTMQGGSMPQQTFQHCVDAETDKLMNANFAGGGPGQSCSKQDMRREGGAIVVDSVCIIGGATVTSHTVISGDFNSAYTVKTSSKREGGPARPNMPATTEITVAAKYTGACKAGQRPGDIIMPNGQTMNIRDVPKMGGGAGRH